MKSIAVVIKMAFMQSKNVICFNFLQNYIKNSNFQKSSLKIIQEIAFQISTISVLFFEPYQENPKIRIFISSLAWQKMKELNFCCSLLFLQLWLKLTADFLREVEIESETRHKDRVIENKRSSRVFRTIPLIKFCIPITLHYLENPENSKSYLMKNSVWVRRQTTEMKKKISLKSTNLAIEQRCPQFTLEWAVCFFFAEWFFHPFWGKQDDDDLSNIFL